MSLKADARLSIKYHDFLPLD